MNVINIISKIKSNLYLIIPILGTISLSLYLLLKNNFDIFPMDLNIMYIVINMFLDNPLELYNPLYRFYHLPFFAIVLLPLVLLFPLFIGKHIFYIIMNIIAILFVVEYNKILILMDVKKKMFRFLFLVIISCGIKVFEQFYLFNYKLLMGLMILFVIRKELQFRLVKKEKDYKYYFINYFLFAFAIAIFPYIIFFLLIYFFQDVRPIKIFNKKNLTLCAIMISAFMIQNFLIIIYPSYFFNILGLFMQHNKYEREWGFPFFYLKEWTWVVIDDYSLVILISTIFIIFTMIILILNKKMNLENKFAWFSFANIMYSAFADRVLVFLIPLALLLFIPFLNQEVKSFEFIKKNIIVFIGILSIAGIAFMLPDVTIFKYVPILQQFPIVVFAIYLRWIFLLGILTISLIILYLYQKNLKI